MTKRLRLLSILLLMAVASHGQQKIVFTPQWTAQAQFAGFYVADVKGFYREAGLDVSIRHPSASNPCINLLKEGKSQVITLQLLTAIQHIDHGVPLMNLMQTLQNNSQMIVSHKPLKSIQDLKGKRVGCWKAGFVELPYIMNSHNKLDIEWIPYVSNINLFISKAIDAAIVQSYNEFFQLVLAGQRFQDNQLINMADIGYNIPEDGLYVTADYYKKHKATVDKFVAASKKGWEWAVAHPDETLDIVMETCRKHGVKTNRPIQRWMLQQMTDLTKDRKTGKRTYRLDPAALTLAVGLMRDNGFIKSDITYQQITQP